MGVAMDGTTMRKRFSHIATTTKDEAATIPGTFRVNGRDTSAIGMARPPTTNPQNSGAYRPSSNSCSSGPEPSSMDMPSILYPSVRTSANKKYP